MISADKNISGFERKEFSMQNEKRSKIGSALLDYIIPTAIVGLALGLALYYIWDSGNLQKFIEASMNANVDTDGTMNINSF